MSPASPSWSEHALAVLASAGHQRGGARARVIELLGSESCALGAIEIEQALRGRGRPVGRASIYRVLELLVEHGLVERVHTGQGQARFETIDPAGQHHHHLVCRACGRLVPFDDPGLERAIERLSKRLGARVEHHDVLLRGACRACA